MIFTHQQLHILFCGGENGFGIDQVTLADGASFTASGAPLWSVEFIHQATRKKVLVTAPGNPETAGKNGVLRLLWQNVVIENGTTCQVEVTVSPDAADQSAWELSVDKVDAAWSVYRVVFPCFDWQLEASGDYKMAVPTDRGLLYENPLETLPDRSELWTRRKFRERKYPNSFMAMQMLGMFRKDEYLYFAAHDPEARVKTMFFAPEPENGRIIFRPAIHTALNYGGAWTSCSYVLGMGKGDWYDLAQRYRAFAITAPWTAAGPLDEFKKTPRWYQDTPIVLLKDYRGELYDTDAFVKVAEYLQVPLLLHYYLWHKSAFDTDYPFLFPATPEFRRDAKRLQAAGVRVMPYLNGYSADTGMSEWPMLKPAAIQINEKGDLHAPVWSQDRALAAMCPASALWKRVMGLVALRCADMGMDGIYFDEIACSPAHNCYADNHGHQPGDEKAFTAGHLATMGAIREEAREINPEIVFTSESCAEPYMQVLDSYLTGNGNDNREIPLFTAVYHDYVMGFGQYIFADELADSKYDGAIIGKCARQFSTGSQFAWSRIPMLAIIERNPEAAAFIKTLAHAWVRHADHLARGRMLRPLAVGETAGNPPLTRRWCKSWCDKTGEEITLPSVLVSLWLKNNSEIAVVMVNQSREAHRVTIDLYAHNQEYPLPQAGSVRLCTHQEGRLTESIADGSSDCFEADVPALSCVVALLGSEKPYGGHDAPLMKTALYK